MTTTRDRTLLGRMSGRGGRFTLILSRQAILAALVITLLACGQRSEPPSVNAPQSGQPSSNIGPVEDGQWPMAAKNYESTRYSGLDEINTSNAAGLQVAWTFSTGVNRGQEAAPIIVGETLP